MRDNSSAAELWGEGLREWQAGRLEEAATALRAAISSATPADINRSMYYGALGGVLIELGRDIEAEAALAASVEFSLIEAENDNASSTVAVARYRLADHLFRHGRFAEAIDTTEPSVGIGARLEGLLRYVRALALAGGGDMTSARPEARMAVDLATSPEQRESFEEQLHEILGSAV